MLDYPRILANGKLLCKDERLVVRDELDANEPLPLYPVIDARGDLVVQ